MEDRGLLIGLWKAALSGVDPEDLVARLFASPRRIGRGRRVGVFASGKAAASMAAGVPRGFAHASLLVVPRGSRVPPRLRTSARFAAHPLPDRSSLAAAREALGFFRGFGPEDLVVALVSGGTSSLLCLPRRGVTLAEKRRRVRQAMENGWPIDRINRLRCRLSRIKGGKLAEATRARVVTLVLSDVPGHDFRIVGSGPTVSARKPGDRAVLLGGNRTGLEAAARWARGRGLRVSLDPRILSGEASETGRRIAAKLSAGRSEVALAGGETTVSGLSGGGTGGRSQEVALGAALELAARRSAWKMLAAGSDGIDGNSGNAGAFADASTPDRARGRHRDPAATLLAHDTANLFEALGDNFRTGPTRGNVADWVFAVRAGAR